FNEKSFKEKKNVIVFTKHLVEKINPKDKFILVRNLDNNKQTKFEYDSLVIAAGSIPKTIPQLNQNFQNVFTLKNISDLIHVQDYLNNNNIKNILIFGSGYIGLEAADVFRQKNYNVILIEKEKLPLPYAEEEIRQLILEVLNKNKIRFIGGVKTFKVFSENNLVQRINIDERLIESDLIISAIGFSPNNGLAKSCGLEIGNYGGIKVDKKLMTSDSHIFAAGDCIEIINAITNKPYYLPLASIAHQYGHTAGENAAGNYAKVDEVVKNIGVKIFDSFNVSVGLSSKEAEKYNFDYSCVDAKAFNLVKVMPESREVYGKIIYEKKSKRILGASFFGNKETAGNGDLISSLIKTNQSAKILEKINYNYSPPLSPYVNLLSLLGRKIK
ncbi:MAG: FAD-dependent oxidoreductase, partial [Ignavibacteriaceae bacterium]